MSKEEQIRGANKSYSFQSLWPATRKQLPNKNFIYITAYLEASGGYNMDEIKIFKTEEVLKKDLAENSQQPFFYMEHRENDNPKLIINDLILGNPEHKIGNQLKFK